MAKGQVFLALLFALFPVSAQVPMAQVSTPAQDASRRTREPWDWTDEERIASLLDTTAAAARLHAHRSDLSSRPGVSATATSNDGPVLDVISGRRDPHLFLRPELFRSLLKLAYADDPAIRTAYRESMEGARKDSGLPADLWERLEAITAAYRSDRSEEIRILRDTALSASARDAAAVVNSKDLCRDGHAALAEATAVFGHSFTRFLYAGVAPTCTDFVVARSTRKELLSAARGDCE